MKKSTAILFVGVIGFVILLSMRTGYAQSPIWTLPNIYLEFNNPNNLPTPSGTDVYAGEQAQFAHNAAYNPVTGKLLFFVVDNMVYDKDGYLINEMFSPETNRQVKGTSEIAIVPDPGNCKRYYIFAGGREYSETFEGHRRTDMYYSILDLETPRTTYNTSRKGDLVPFEPDYAQYTARNVASFIPLSDYPSGHLNSYKTDVVHVAVSTPIPNTDNRLLAFQLGNTYIYHFELSPQGLAYKSVINPLTGAYPEIAQLLGNNNRSELEIIRIGDTYRIGGQTHYGKTIFTYDLDFNGNAIPFSYRSLRTALETTTGYYIKGLEFSENGRYLYFSHGVHSEYPKAIECFDRETSSLVTLPAIPTNQLQEFQFSQLEMGQDGKIYAVTENRMASISNTNNPSQIVWNNNALSLSNYNLSSFNFTEYLNGFNETVHVPNGALLYLLPDQIDKQDCVVDCFESCSSSAVETACCSYYRNIDESSVSGYTVTSNTIWTPGGGNNNPFGSTDGKVYFSGDLIIPAGKILTLNGMELYFAPNAKVIVQRSASSTSGTGGKLVLNGSTLSVDDRCGSCLMWPGVEVHGHPNLDQGFSSSSSTSHSSRQGAVFVLANSKIEHALRGITAGLVSSSSETVSAGYSGGFVGVVNSTFFNNQVDVIMAAYKPVNRSYFRNSQFITNGFLNEVSRTPNYHIGLFRVNNITVQGCTFRNQTPGMFNSNQQGIGIASIDSKFSVNRYCVGISLNCTNPVRSTFENLSTGIVAISIFSAPPYLVDNSDFLNNHTGIYTSNVNTFKIQRTVFEVYKSVAPNYTFETVGIHITNCTGYTVQENTLYESTASGIFGFGNSIGILVDNSGTSDNEIYKNTFRNLRVGGQSQRVNSIEYGDNYPNNIGLRWKCNDFDKRIYQADLAITSGRIAYEQGHCFPLGHPWAAKSPAGNSFSHNGLVLGQNNMRDIWANDGVNPFNYAHHSDNFTTPYDYTSSVVMPENCATNGEVLFNNRSCPSRIRSIGVIDRLPDIVRERKELEANIAENEEKLQKGSKVELIQMIENSSISHGEKKNTLMSESPYLSDEVLISYIKSNRPVGHLVQVVTANSPVSETVWSEIEELSIPNGIKKQLVNAQTGVSARTYLLNELSFAKSERSLLNNELEHIYWMDTTLVGATDSIKALIEEENTGVELLKARVEFYLKISNIEEAEISLNEYVSVVGEDDFVKLAKYAIQASSLGCMFKEVKENLEKRNEMKEIAEHHLDSKQCTSARSLLEFALEESYTRHIEQLISTRSMMISQNTENELNSIVEENEMIKLFPNPAKDEFFVVLDESSENLAFVEITMYSFTGQQVKQIQSTDRLQTIAVPVNDLSQGMYLVVVTLNGEVVSQQKMAVK